MGSSVIFSILAFLSCFGFTRAATCYYYSYTYWTTYSSYCSGYCSGYYGYETCLDGSLSDGAIVGVVIGCLIFFGMLITVISCICCKYKQRAGQTGRMVYPSQGVSTIAHPNGYQSSMAYPPPSAPFSYQPPGYSQAPQPPPNYHPTYQSNHMASAPPIEHKGHDYR